MGTILSKNKYVIQIDDIKLTSKEFREIKSYKDILKVAGHTVTDTTTIRKMDKHSTYFHASEPFQFGGTLIHDGKSIYIRKLY